MDGTNWLDGKANMQMEHVRFAELRELYLLYRSKLGQFGHKQLSVWQNPEVVVSRLNEGVCSICLQTG